MRSPSPLSPLLLVFAIACDGGGGSPDDTSPDTHADVLADNGDGTFTSSLTGLTWEGAPPTDKFRWVDAATRCDALELADESDWRLPTISELRTLIRGCEGTVTDGECPVTDACAENACRAASCYACQADAGPSGGCYGPSEMPGECDTYWSATEVGDGDGAAWFVSFNDGHVYSYSVGNNYNVRCVRP